MRAQAEGDQAVDETQCPQTYAGEQAKPRQTEAAQGWQEFNRAGQEHDACHGSKTPQSDCTKHIGADRG